MLWVSKAHEYKSQPSVCGAYGFSQCNTLPPLQPQCSKELHHQLVLQFSILLQTLFPKIKYPGAKGTHYAHYSFSLLSPNLNVDGEMAVAEGLQLNVPTEKS